MFTFEVTAVGGGFIYTIYRDGVFFSNSVPMRQVSADPATFEVISEADATANAEAAVRQLNGGTIH